MKLTKDHYDFYCQHKIKSIAGYKPLHVVSIHTLIPHKPYKTELSNFIAVIKMVRKRQTILSYLKSIVIDKAFDRRQANCKKWLKRLTS